MSSFVRKNISNGVFRKVTSSTAFGGGGANMLSLTSSVNSGATTVSTNGNSTTTSITTSGNSGSSGIGSGNSGGSSGGNGGCAEIEILMNSAIVTDISEIGKNYASGAFDLIKSQLNQTLYNNYSYGLYNARNPSNATYEKVRKFINTNELLAQLNMLRGSMSLFPDQHITVIPVEIKPEYLAYIKTYGYPENGIWDPDLLGSIIASIQPVIV
jgi:hypothetical protein